MSGPAAERGHSSLFARLVVARSLGLRPLVARFWPFARRYRWWFLVSLGFVAVGPMADAVTIWLFKLLVDEVLVPRDLAPLAAIAPAYVGVTLISGITSFGERYLSSRVSQRFIIDVRLHVFAHVQRLSPEFFDRHPIGDLVTRLGADVGAIEGLMLSGVTDLLRYLLQIVFFTGALFVIDARLALLALTVTPGFWYAARRVSRALKRAAREQRRRSGAASAVAEESFASTSLVQAYGLEERETRRYAAELLAGYEATMEAVRARAVFGPLVDVFQLAGVLMVVAVGTLGLEQGTMSLGGLLVFVTYLDRLYRPVRGMASLANSAFAAAAGGERVAALLDESPTIASGALGLARARGEVRFDDVWFSYPAASCPALAGVSFSVRPGEVVALVGESGAGKTTAAKLVLRFYDPARGRITLDGHDLRELDLSDLRRAMAPLFQEALLIDDTLAENVRLGRSGASDADVARACELAGLDRFVRAQPDRYESRTGQNGRRLSGGQRQRLAMARAFVRDAPVLLLDEPTSGLDAATAEAIVSGLHDLAAGRATIVISHSLLCVRQATRIVVLDHGTVVEQGAHDELLARGGHYARLFRLRRAEVAA